MFYIEEVINGVLCYKTSPAGIWRPLSDTKITERYSQLKEQLSALVVENEKLKELESIFYMAICRAYNSGKQCMNNQHEDARNGKEFNTRFVSSHDYFIGEFHEFTTNVP